MGKRIYTHIGIAKTGTTALQQFFMLNRRLLKRKGLLYPTLGLVNLAHHKFAWGFGYGEKTVMQKENGVGWKKLSDISNRFSGDILISSEALHSVFCNPKHSEEIRDSIINNGNIIKVIIYLRRQDHLSESRYFNTVKNGKTSEEPLAWCLKKNYHYDRQLKTLSRIFGKENIIVRVYEKSQFFQGTIYSDFLNCVGINWSNEFKIPEGNPNPSLSRGTVKILQLANSFDLEPWNRRIIYDNIIDILRNSETEGIFVEKKILSPQDRIEIMKRYKSGNEAVAQDYLGREDGRLFHEALPDADEPWQPYQEVSAEAVMNISIKLLKRLLDNHRPIMKIRKKLRKKMIKADAFQMGN
jgi:hypothetical protein